MARIRSETETQRGGAVSETSEGAIVEVQIKVAPTYEQDLARARAACELLDRHVKFESALQGQELTPPGLCDEQRASLAADLREVLL